MSKKTRARQTDSEFISDSKSAILFRTPPFAYIVLYVLILFLIVAFVWAYFAKLDEVTVAEGEVVPYSQLQILQNLEGGIVKRIYVKEGQRVVKGQPLIQLDETLFSSSYKENFTKFVTLVAMNKRLSAQAAGKGRIHYSEAFEKKFPKVVAAERRLFQTNMKALRDSTASLKNQLDLLQQELKIIEPLVEKKIVTKIDLLKLQREENQAKKDLHEIESKFQKQSLSELNENKAELDALKESLFALRDRQRRTTIRSPVNGVVNNIHYNTIGAVIKPGVPIMEVVPLGEKLLIEAKVKPSDIAFIHPGQKATVKFTAYDFSIYGGLPATVIHISPSTVLGKDGQTQYYEIRLETKKTHLTAKGKDLEIIPGMTVTVDILTGEKTVLQYLLKPLTKASQTAMRER